MINTMKSVEHFILSIFLIGLSFSLHAQDWNTHIDVAKDIATTENKPILLVFQGSDWCVPCIKLDREVWQSTVFKNYAQKHLVLLKSDFPKQKRNKLTQEQAKQNASLAEKYNEQGVFPFVVLLDKNGKVLSEIGYLKINPERYVKRLDAILSK